MPPTTLPAPRSRGGSLGGPLGAETLDVVGIEETSERSPLVRERSRVGELDDATSGKPEDPSGLSGRKSTTLHRPELYYRTSGSQDTAAELAVQISGSGSYRLSVTLGDRLRAAREQAGLKQFDLVIQLRRRFPDDFKGTTDKRVSEWENDRVPRIPFYVVAAVAAVTGKPLEFFATSEPAAERPTRSARGTGGVAPAAPARGGEVASLQKALERAERERDQLREELLTRTANPGSQRGARRAEG